MRFKRRYVDRIRRSVVHNRNCLIKKRHGRTLTIIIVKKRRIQVRKIGEINYSAFWRRVSKRRFQSLNRIQKKNGGLVPWGKIRL